MAYNWLTGNTPAPGWAKPILRVGSGRASANPANQPMLPDWIDRSASAVFGDAWKSNSAVRAEREYYGPAYRAPKDLVPIPGQVGGGNAGASIQPPMGGQGARKAPTAIAPVNTPVTGNFSGARRASVAAQNAAQAASREPFWQANPAMAQAAMDAGKAAEAARKAQGGGYLSSGSGLPATSDPSQQAYWERADIQAWAAANKGLADELKKKHGYTGPAPVGTSFDPNARTGLEFNPAAQSYSVDPNAPAQPSLAASLQASPQLPEGFDPSSTMFNPQGAPAGVPASFNPSATAFSAPAAPIGTDPAQRVAPAQMPTTGDTAVDPAQALNREFLDSIKASWVPEEEELANPAYYQPSTAYAQPAWPQGWF